MEINYEKIKKLLQKNVDDFEKKNGKDYSFYLSQNDELVHSMKVKGMLFSKLDLDSEFESADLLDFLGYERIISCRRDHK